jgi:hypothetical protein
MKTFTVLLSLLLFPIVNQAQNNRPQNAYLELLTVAQITDHKSIPDEKGVDGSPYFISTFFPGKVYLKDQLANDEFQLRYNAFKDEIEVDKGSFVEILLKNEDISAIIGPSKYIYKKAIEKRNGLYQHYFRVLHENTNSSLLLKESVTFKEAKIAKNSQTMSFPAKYVQYEEYHFIDGRSKLAMPLNKKSILEATPTDQKAAMKKFIKQENIYFTNVSHLIKLIDYYNSLLSTKQ